MKDENIFSDENLKMAKQNERNKKQMKKVIQVNKFPIKLWLDNIEQGALEQAENLARLPFAYRHIAIMPDSHQGYGMPIGGVMATKDVVVPNAVGVDIGCFTGDTMVKLTDDRSLSFLELLNEHKKGKINFIYSKDKDNSIVIEKIQNVLLTRKVNELLEIELDSGEKYKCTTDHIHYLFDGREIKASELRIGDSLFSLYVKQKEEKDDDLMHYKNKRNKLSSYNIVFNPRIQKYNHKRKSHPELTKVEYSNINHKIKSIRKIKVKEIPVYCLQINNTHNFALNAGVFVHNCGMCAVKTSLTDIDKETLKKIMGEIRKVIPVGFNKHKEGSKEYKENTEIIDKFIDKHFEII